MFPEGIDDGVGVPGILLSITLVFPGIMGMTSCTTAAAIGGGWVGSWRRWFRSGVLEKSGDSPSIGFALGSEGISVVYPTKAGDCQRALGAQEQVQHQEKPPNPQNNMSYLDSNKNCLSHPKFF